MIRSLRERVVQSLAYEAVGLLLVLPAFVLFTGVGMTNSVILLISLSVLLMLWAGIHNTGFDWLEWYFFQSVASDRSARCRMLHAVSLEFTSVLVSVPVILLLTDLRFIDAVIVDIALTVSYVIYGFLFHYTYDYFRPVKHGELSG